ncbi:E3 ubiquitin-protein ligase UPL3-like isoform X1 [Brassica napus]|uniref:E3 ubiquitin-protein ligase UPL3-like isoform X1 n=1 Tax=Brassica napus TaxID=3708 RepID=UPI000BBEFBA4|nr:E3 ubiquitin-protein ligase UPL3-like isoform X1 [Brassica napus]
MCMKYYLLMHLIMLLGAVPLLTNLLQYHDSKLDELCNHGLVTQAASLLSTTNSGRGQASLAGHLLDPGHYFFWVLVAFLRIFYWVLLSLLMHLYPPALSRPADQIFEIVYLANELLPPLPQGVISLPTAGTNTLVKSSGQKNPSPSTSGKREDSLKVSPRQNLLSDQPELLQQFGLDLLPVLVQVIFVAFATKSNMHTICCMFNYPFFLFFSFQ